ncbi:MAG: reverse transcriptase family protein [Deltaproteobacteria bacterium]|nr:reverse transcriptase family protein [Deltaproteobacteria bacterium]
MPSHDTAGRNSNPTVLPKGKGKANSVNGSSVTPPAVNTHHSDDDFSLTEDDLHFTPQSAAASGSNIASSSGSVAGGASAAPAPRKRPGRPPAIREPRSVTDEELKAKLEALDGALLPLFANLPSAVLNRPVRSVENVPKGARSIWADVVQDAVNRIGRHGDNVAAWIGLSLLPRFVLNKLKEPAEKDEKLTSLIKRRCNLLLFPHLHANSLTARMRFLEEPDPIMEFDFDNDEASDRVRKRHSSKASRLIEAGHLSKTLRLLQSSGIADCNDNVLTKLRERHPAPRTDLSLDEIAPPIDTRCFQLSMDPEEFNFPRFLLDLPKGSAPGLDGWRFEHLRVLAGRGDCCFMLLHSLNMILKGRLPEGAVECFANCRLIPLKKGEDDVRPIAIASCLRRLTSRLVCSKNAADFQAYFKPVQFGVAIRGGAEAIIHYTRAHLKREPDHCLVQVDIKNAFNQVSRQSFFETLAQDFPSLFRYAKCFYGIEGQLFINDDTCIASREGVQQGDPLGPFLFCLAMHPVLSELTASHPQCKVLAYMDDISILGPPAAAFRVFEDLKTLCAGVGLQVNPNKCVVFSRPLEGLGVDFGATPVVDLESGCIKVLGAPIGEVSACGSWLLDRTKEIIEASKCLAKLDSLQERWLLFKLCVAQSFTFFMRTCPMEVLGSGLSEESRPVSVWRTFLLEWLRREALIDTWLPGSQEQVFLPAILGGLGFVDPSHGADAAYYGSWCLVGSMLHEFDPALIAHALESAGNGPLRDVFSAYQRLNDGIRPEILAAADQLPTPESVIEGPCLYVQSRAASLLAKSHLEIILQHDNAFPEWSMEDRVSIRARIRSCGGTGASSFLSTVPSFPQLRMHNSEFAFSLRFRLGLNHPALQHHLGTKCKCGHTLSCANDVHPVMCSGAGSLATGESIHSVVIDRHNHVRNLLFGIVRRAGVAGTLEPVVGADINKKRLDIVATLNGEETFFDVSICTATAPSYVSRASRANGRAAGEREYLKFQKYKNLVGEAFGTQLLPLVWESHGRAGEYVFPVLSDLALLAVRRSPFSPDAGSHGEKVAHGRQIDHWLSRISVTLQKANSSIFDRYVEWLSGCHRNGSLNNGPSSRSFSRINRRDVGARAESLALKAFGLRSIQASGTAVQDRAQCLRDPTF